MNSILPAYNVFLPSHVIDAESCAGSCRRSGIIIMYNLDATLNSFTVFVLTLWLSYNVRNYGGFPHSSDTLHLTFNYKGSLS